MTLGVHVLLHVYTHSTLVDIPGCVCVCGDLYGRGRQSMPYGGINMYSSASGELQKFMALAIQDSGGSGGGP